MDFTGRLPAFYVRNASSYTSNGSQSAVNGIEERCITSMRIYCYQVTICTSGLETFPYYPDPANAVSQQQSAKEPELQSPVPVCNKEEQVQTITSSGIYKPVKRRASYYHEAYKQVITINEVPWQDLRTNLKQYCLPSQQELNGQARQQCNKRQIFTDKRKEQATAKTKPFTVTNGSHRIRDQTFKGHCLIVNY